MTQERIHFTQHREGTVRQATDNTLVELLDRHPNAVVANVRASREDDGTIQVHVTADIER